jgi:hypothetical protein
MVQDFVVFIDYEFTTMNVMTMQVTSKKNAKIALMMFYPFWKLEDLQVNGSYWNLESFLLIQEKWKKDYVEKSVWNFTEYQEQTCPPT